MNHAVGIDVSKGKSMVAAVNFTKEVTLTPHEFEHTEVGLERLIYNHLLALDGGVRVIMEATGRYHDPIVAALHEAGIYVCVVNPLVIHDYGRLHDPL
jgi:transposase